MAPVQVEQIELKKLTSNEMSKKCTNIGDSLTAARPAPNKKKTKTNKT